MTKKKKKNLQLLQLQCQLNKPKNIVATVATRIRAFYIQKNAIINIYSLIYCVENVSYITKLH